MATIYRDLSAWLRKHAIAASLIVFFCSTSVRLFEAWRADLDLAKYPDAPTYLNPAVSLIERGTFLDSSKQPMIDRTPGYPTFLAGIMLLVGSDLRDVIIIQAFILSSGVMILYWFGKRVLPPVMAFTGALIASFSPWGAVLAAIPMSEGLYLFLLSLIFFLMKLTENVSGTSSLLVGAICIGLLTGTAVLVRPLWPLCILVPGALLYLRGFKRRGTWLLIIVTLTFAALPVELWRERNERQAQFNQLSDIAGKTIFRYLAARVTAEINGANRHAVSALAYEEERHWHLSRLQADTERWKRAEAVFREHPFLTVYSFFRSAFEHAIHPSPDVLTPAHLNFYGDFVLLALAWGTLLLIAGYAVFWHEPYPDWDDGQVDRRWLLTIFFICSALTLSSGITFAAGSRLRAPLEAIVPLLAAVGIVRATRAVCVRFQCSKNPEARRDSYPSIAELPVRRQSNQSRTQI